MRREKTSPALILVLTWNLEVVLPLDVMLVGMIAWRDGAWRHLDEEPFGLVFYEVEVVCRLALRCWVDNLWPSSSFSYYCLSDPGLGWRCILLKSQEIRGWTVDIIPPVTYTCLLWKDSSIWTQERVFPQSLTHVPYLTSCFRVSKDPCFPTLKVGLWNGLEGWEAIVSLLPFVVSESLVDIRVESELSGKVSSSLGKGYSSTKTLNAVTCTQIVDFVVGLTGSVRLLSIPSKLFSFINNEGWSWK